MEIATQLQNEMKYLSLLSSSYPNVEAAAEEIANLSAILSLPKGTEHFMSDIHGEDEAFTHILNNASGVIREKIDDVLPNTSADYRSQMASLIYYPEEKLDLLREKGELTREWYSVTLLDLIDVCRAVTSKYSRSRVRRALPEGFGFIIDELIHGDFREANKKAYYSHIISSTIDIGRADAFIVAICGLIKRMSVDHLHIVGDIFDRGPHPEIIMDKLRHHHSVDVQWGNHDILWMGAAAGSRACIAYVLYNCLKYGNLDVIENGYGINILPLALFAAEVYTDDTETFKPKAVDFSGAEGETLIRQMEKAIFVLLMKLEGQIIARHPEYDIDDRAMLRRVNYENMTIELDGKVHPLTDTVFPTINPEDPCAFTPEEEKVLSLLESAFLGCEKLQKHRKFLLNNGSLYLTYNHNLLFHGCIPCNEDGSFRVICMGGRHLSGKAYMDYADSLVRKTASEPYGSEAHRDAQDFMWFLWCGKNSPLFGRDRITTFERALIADTDTWKESQNPYFYLKDEESFCTKVLEEFGLTSPHSHIINGHVPVRVSKGEGPVKAGGKLIVIDGGFCRAYQNTTGIAGYTMFFSSHGIRIASHHAFESVEESIRHGKDIEFETMIIENLPKRMYIKDTDIGKGLMQNIEDLKRLLTAYRLGLIKEKLV